MFYLLVELNSYRQLRRLKHDILHDIEHRISAILADCGASPVSSENGQYYFRFDSVRAGEHEHILDTAVRVRGYLDQYSSSLAGFSVYLDVDQTNSTESAVRQLRSMALRTAIEQEVVVGEAAAIAVEPYARLEKRGSFFVVGEKHERPSVSATSYRDFLKRETAIESILDACEQFVNRRMGGAVLIHGPEDVGKGIAAFHAAMKIYGRDGEGWPFEVGPMGAVGFAPLAYCLTTSRLHLLETAMSRAERTLFRRHRAAIDGLRTTEPTDEFVDSPDTDIAIAFRSVAFAYLRLMASQNLPAFFVCYGAHDYDQASLRILQSVLKDLDGSPAIVLLTSEKPFLPMALRELPHTKLEIRRPTVDEWRKMAARVTGPALGSASVLSTVSGGHAVFHSLVAEHAFSRDELQNRLPPSTRLLAALEDEYVETMLAVTLVDGALTVELLSVFMGELGVARVRTPELVNDLQRLGYLRRSVMLSSAVQGLAEAISVAFPATARKVTTAMVHFLRPALAATKPVYAFILDAGDAQLAVQSVAAYLDDLLERRRFREARTALYGTLPAFRGSSETQNRSTLHLLLYVHRLRLALLSRDEATADRVFPGWRNLTVYSPTSTIHGDYLFTKAQYLNAKGARDDGLTLVKKAILAYQEADAPRGVARANAEFGLVLLSQGNVSAARDYFAIATRTGAQLGDRRGALHAGLLELGTDVSLGNLTRAREKAENLKAEAERLALRREELYFDFVLGRIAFELGTYERAEAIFTTALCDADILQEDEARSLLQRWLGRSVAYRGAPKRGLEIVDATAAGAEGVLFRVEALILLGQYGDAAKAALAAPDPASSTSFRPGEALAWDSGFANIEDRSADAADGVVSHLVSAFAAYAQAEHGEPAAGIEILHRLTRAGGSAIRDPYAALYLLLYSEILPENGGEELEDMVTILGKAVKHLQERTSRIDNYADKTSYLRKSYWNAFLTEKAKRYNLV